jgi:hypothetical protein
LENKRYKLVCNASYARKIMKLGRCFPVDIKPHRESKETDAPSVFVFQSVYEKEYKVIQSPAEARHLLKDGKRLVDIKPNARPKESDVPTVFVFEVTKEFEEDFAKICESENYNLGGN